MCNIQEIQQALDRMEVCYNNIVKIRQSLEKTIQENKIRLTLGSDGGVSKDVRPF